jgi:hypothetical protein
MQGKKINLIKLFLVLFLSVSFASFSQKDDKVYAVENAETLKGQKLIIGKMKIKGENLSDSQLQILNYSFAKGTRLKLLDAMLLRKLKRSSAKIRAKKVSLKIEPTSNPKEVSVLIVIE